MIGRFVARMCRTLAWPLTSAPSTSRYSAGSAVRIVPFTSTTVQSTIDGSVAERFARIPRASAPERSVFPSSYAAWAKRPSRTSSAAVISDCRWMRSVAASCPVPEAEGGASCPSATIPAPIATRIARTVTSQGYNWEFIDATRCWKTGRREFKACEIIHPLNTPPPGSCS